MNIGENPIKMGGEKAKEQTPLQKAREESARSRELGKGAVVFQLARGKTRTHIIKARCIAIEGGKEVAYRYIRGIKEIREEHQVTVGQTAKAIVLRQGKIVASTDALKEFLRKHPDNMDNGGGVFYEYNPVKLAKENLKSEKARDKAKYMAGEGLKDDEAYKIAKLLKLQNIDQLSGEEIRMFLRSYADQSPDDFNNLIESPEPEMNDVLMRAIGSGIVEVTAKELKYKGGGKIVDLPNMDTNAQMEHVIRWGLTEKDGQDFFEVIRKE